MSFESLELKGLTTKDIIDEATKEEAKLLDEIDPPKKIGGYEIKTSYTGLLNPGEKGFAIELSSKDNLAIFVKIDENGDLVVFDKQGQYSINDFADEVLDEGTESANPYVNLINRAIKSLGYTQLDKKGAKKLLAVIEKIKHVD